MKRMISLSLCTLLMLCLFAPTVFAEDIFHNTLNDQVTLTDVENFKTYTIGYTVACNSSSDWNLRLIEEEKDNAVFGQSYTACVRAGCTLSAQLTSFEDMGLGVFLVAYDENGQEIGGTEAGNGESNAETVNAEFTVPEDAAAVGIFLMAMPRQGGIGAPGSLSITVEMTVDGTEKAPVGTAGLNDSPDTNNPPDGNNTDTPSDLEWIMEDKSDEVDSLSDTLTELAKGAVKAMILAGVIGIGLIAAIIAIVKSAAAKKAAAAGIKAAGKTAGKAAAMAAPTENTAVSADSGSVSAEDSYVVTDPATGAQTLYIKDQATGEWVSSDGSSVLDTDKLPEWQKQRTADRAWQDKVNEEVKKPTKFEEIDRKQALEEERIHRESYYEKIAIQHGMDASDMDAVFEKVSHDQARAEVDAQKWTEIAEHNDTGLKIAENLKTTADYSVSALGAVTGPAGTLVKDIYAAGTTIGGDVATAVAEGKDAFEVAQTAAGAVTKSAVSVIQNHASGVVGKSAADIIGGAATGGVDAYVKGENVGQGIAKGTVSGVISATVDTGGEMAGALRDGSSLGKDAKDFVSSVSDIAGDFVKNKTADAVNESFDKTFEELNPKK